MSEDLNDRLAILSVFIVEVRIHTAHQVGMSTFQVVKGFLCRFQLDDVGDVKFLTQHLEQVDVVAYSLAILVEEGIRPQIPCVFINKWVFFGERVYAVVSLLCRNR